MRNSCYKQEILYEILVINKICIQNSYYIQEIRYEILVINKKFYTKFLLYTRNSMRKWTTKLQIQVLNLVQVPEYT